MTDLHIILADTGLDAAEYVVERDLPPSYILITSEMTRAEILSRLRGHDISLAKVHVTTRYSGAHGRDMIIQQARRRNPDLAFYDLIDHS